nr:PTS glucose transporter subunit IIA [uncultured Acetatifactor sp.]
MGVFDFLKKKEIVLGAPAEGECVPLSQVQDPTFGEEILGKGIAVIPSVGTIYAPADGEISTVFPTGHAAAMTTPEGVEILIHVGLDTVNLGGKHFQVGIKEGDKVKKGDVLIQADIEGIKNEGYDIITPMVICNTQDFEAVEGITGIHVYPGEDCLKIRKE